MVATIIWRYFWLDASQYLEGIRSGHKGEQRGILTDRRLYSSGFIPWAARGETTTLYTFPARSCATGHDDLQFQALYINLGIWRRVSQYKIISRFYPLMVAPRI